MAPWLFIRKIGTYCLMDYVPEPFKFLLDTAGWGRRARSAASSFRSR